MRLTALQIEQIPIPTKGQKTYWENGFGVRASQGGSKSFVVMYGDRRQLKTLGKYPAMSLKTAREAAQRFKLSDTPSQRLESFPAAREAFLRDCQARLRPATITMYTTYLSQLEKPSLSGITRADIDTHHPQTVATWKAFFNWCIRQELTDKNPFTFIKAQTNRRDRFLTDDEVRAVWSYDYPQFSTIVKLLLLTEPPLVCRRLITSCHATISNVSNWA